MSDAATVELGERCECGCARMSCTRGDLLRCADCGRVWPGAEPLAAKPRKTVTGVPPELADRSAAQGREIILIGSAASPASDAADRLLDGITMALQEFDTETLLAIADYRDTLDPEGWMQPLIRGYVEVWR